jgi:cytochrome b
LPDIFPSLPDDAPRNRLTMARFFFHPQQPLTSRVAVNRFWEQLFGTGIVETLEDFGSIGTTPSHPELIDWLAVHFQHDLNWDIKALLHTLVTSTTYRQSADISAQLANIDPRNRLFAREPRQRLSAEMVRDQALLASGSLSTKMGGPPVMPQQPKGVWRSVYSDEQWIDATGEDRYRRAIYTYIKRSSPYPSFLTFDVANRDISLARRITTNTPLQALVTLNDPVYTQASQSLARRMMAKAQESVASTSKPSIETSVDAALNVGVCGSTTAQFSHFVVSPRTAFRYLRQSIRLEAPHHAGHNPAGGWMVLALIGVLLLQAVSGMLSNNDLGFNGPLSDYISKALSDDMTILHASIFNGILLLIWLHIVAVYFYVLVKNSNLVSAMITGKKRQDHTRPDEVLQFKSLHRATLIFVICATAVTGMIYLT